MAFILVALVVTAIGLRDGTSSAGAVDNLVQAATVDPHASTLGTVVDLDTLAFGHHELDVASWAVHAGSECNSVTAQS
jgi:hypothetical protein